MSTRDCEQQRQECTKTIKSNYELFVNNREKLIRARTDRYIKRCLTDDGIVIVVSGPKR